MDGSLSKTSYPGMRDNPWILNLFRTTRRPRLKNKCGLKKERGLQWEGDLTSEGS
jgi:hypothetical protein